MKQLPTPLRAPDGLAAGGAVSSRYAVLVAEGAIGHDDAQAALAERFDVLAAALAARPQPRGRFLSRLLGAAPAEAPRGLYVWGAVGRGKSMLMDLFFEGLATQSKRRAHFNVFMADVHARVHAYRAQGGDPIAPVARDLAAEAKVLCFDEFMVTNIADAMILGRLFAALFGEGVTVVATSNVEPDRLYEGGINRQLFLPFIAMMRERMDVVRLDARTDFRLEKLAGATVYLTPTDAKAHAALDDLFTRLSGAKHGAPMALDVLGRAFPVPQAAGGVARFTFDQLCGEARGAVDYLALARRFHTVMIEHVPVMEHERINQALRFVTLVDTLYDARVKLILSAEAEPDFLCRANVPVFERTASRLMEMRSEAYLGLHHEPPPSAVEEAESC